MSHPVSIITRIPFNHRLLRAHRQHQAAAARRIVSRCQLAALAIGLALGPACVSSEGTGDEQPPGLQPFAASHASRLAEETPQKTVPVTVVSATERSAANAALHQALQAGTKEKPSSTAWCGGTRKVLAPGPRAPVATIANVAKSKSALDKPAPAP